MKVNITMTVLMGALLTTSLISPVSAAPLKPAKMTCEDYVVLDDVIKPKVMYWTEGFNKNGQLVDDVFDVDETDKLIPVLVAECQKNPKVPLREKVKELKSVKAK
jgi:hypothetical protein